MEACLLSGPGEAFLRFLMDSGTEFEWRDRKIVGERSVFGVKGDRVSLGLGFKAEEMATVICVS